jgi:dihydrofolate reductase
MRKIIAGAFASLDGVMQAPGGPEEDTSGGFAHGGWTVPYWDDATAAFMEEGFRTPYALLLGRRTYDIFAAYWPKYETQAAQADAQEGNLDIARQFNRATKYVATHHPHTLDWQHSQWLGEDVVAALRELKQQDGPRLLVQGSSVLLQALFAADLVDELRLLVYPLVLGKGKRLFGTDTLPAAFKLLESSTSPSGVLLAHYARAGEVETGSFDTAGAEGG